MITPVIMAGGSGTRLWPLSRAGHPKQFLALKGDKTMLQQTLERLADLPVSESVTICNEEHRFFVAEQMREIDALGKIILEPVGRNTAPAIALAALAEKENDALLLVLAADHVVADQKAFTESVMRAVPLAEDGKLVTFGIVPTVTGSSPEALKRASLLDGGTDDRGADVRYVSPVIGPRLLAAGRYLVLMNHAASLSVDLPKAVVNGNVHIVVVGGPVSAVPRHVESA